MPLTLKEKSIKVIEDKNHHSTANVCFRAKGVNEIEDPSWHSTMPF